MFVSACLSFIDVYIWHGPVACLHAGPVTCKRRMWVFADVFLCILFTAKYVLGICLCACVLHCVFVCGHGFPVDIGVFALN